MKQVVSAQRKQAAANAEVRIHPASRLPMQRQVDASPRQDAQQRKLAQLRETQAQHNPKGLPTPLRAGIESLSGLDMGGVTVHRNCARPAQLDALAYAQGNEIHLGPGQEKHLPHEAWHVVQQKQGRVAATVQLNGALVNDDRGLEREADIMGQKALRMDAAARPGAPGAVADRKRMPRIIQSRSLAPIQLGKGKGDKGQAQEEEIGGQLVVRSNVQANLDLLSRVWRLLPKTVRDFLSEIRENLDGQETQEDPSSGEHRVLVARDREHDRPLMRVLNLDPMIIRNVVLGLYVMPTAQQKSLRSMGAIGLVTLFGQLATARHPTLLLLEGPPEGIRIGTTGSEHIQNSCYAAAMLNIIARNAYYRRLFDPLHNPTLPDSNARLMQDAILPLVQRIHSGGTVSAAQMRALLACLNQVGLLANDNVDEEPDQQQQDASQILMGVLDLVRPTQPLTTRETRVYDDGSPNDVQDEDEFVLQLYAHGQHSLLDALSAHFVQGVHSSALHAEDVASPHTVARVITGFPEVLSIGIVRGDEYDSIDMPRQFTIPAAITHNGLPGPTYQLTAYIVRNTISHSSGGHYIAVVSNDDGTWDEMDDMGTPKEGEEGVWSPSTRRVDPSVHRIGGHHAPSYAMATLYTYRQLQAHEVEHGGSTIGFDSNWMMQHPALGDLLMESGLTGKELKERERLIDKFLSSGGTVWDAHKLMVAEPSDNEALQRKLAELEDGKATVDYSDAEAKDEIVQSFLSQGLASSSISELLHMQAATLKHLGEDGSHADFLRKQLIALDLALQQRRSKARKGYTKIFGANAANGMKIEIYATDRVWRNPEVGRWAVGVASALAKAPFLLSRRPPLQIRINLRPQVTKDVANTRSDANLINVNVDDYQATLFTVGETLGLLAHELGVHSLDQTVMSKEELANEEKDARSHQTAAHGGETYTVGRDPGAEGQQDDHLTIGRGVLGQLSALPRLHMYEQTMLSILQEAPDDKAKKEMAAAYCIDMARILVLNDEAGKMRKAGIIGKVWIAKCIASAAAAEWVRIQQKYGRQFPDIPKIGISSLDIAGYLFRLKGILDKIHKEAVEK